MNEKQCYLLALNGLFSIGATKKDDEYLSSMWKCLLKNDSPDNDFVGNITTLWKERSVNYQKYVTIVNARNIRLRAIFEALFQKFDEKVMHEIELFESGNWNDFIQHIAKIENHFAC